MNHPQQHQYSHNGPAPAAYPPAQHPLPGQHQVLAPTAYPPAQHQIPAPHPFPGQHQVPAPAPAFRPTPAPSTDGHGHGQKVLLRVLVVIVSILKFIPPALVTLFLIFAQLLAVDVDNAFAEVGEDSGAFGDIFSSALLLAALIIATGIALLTTQMIGALSGRRMTLIVSAGILTAIDLLFIVSGLLAVDGPVGVGSLVSDFWLMVMLTSAQITILVLSVIDKTDNQSR